MSLGKIFETVFTAKYLPIIHFTLIGLPQFSGWLPSWQLLVAVTAVGNAIQNLCTLDVTRRIYGAEKTGKNDLHVVSDGILAFKYIDALISDYAFACAYFCDLEFDLRDDSILLRL